MNMQGKVAIITGSSMGIGKAIAHELGAAGARIVLNGRTASRLETTRAALAAAGIEAIAVAGDVSTWEGSQALVAETLARFGQIDILINNAGASTRGSVEALDPAVFRKVLEVNILGTIYPTKAALPHLRAQGGSVILVSSLAGLHGLPFNAVYSSSKMALTALAQSLRVEEPDLHVGIAYVGFTENDPQKEIFDADGRRIYLEARQGVRKQTPAQVAAIIHRMIRRRQRQRVLSVPGRFLAVVNRFFPRLIAFIYARNRATIKANSEGAARPVTP